MNDPVYVVLEPSANTTERVYVSPALAVGAPVPQVTVAVIETVDPGTIDVVDDAIEHEPPPNERVPDDIVVLLVPELTKYSVPVGGAAAANAVWVLIVTLAFAAALPNMPKMYPSTAAKAMSVAAMMRTVAMIGEIAFLRCPEIFIEPRCWPRILTLQESGYGCRIHISQKSAVSSDAGLSA